MTERCPSSLALEAVLLAPERAPAAAHAKGCEKCRARLVQMEREGEEFRRFVLPATLAAVEKPVRKRAPWAFIFAPAAALAAAAALILAVRPGGPAADYEGTKGGHLLKLSIYTGGAEKAHQVADREQVPAGAALRFRVQAGAPCRLWIVSIDETGEVSRLFPAAGPTGAAVSGQVTLPGGVELDSHAGPERVYAVCTPEEIDLQSVEGAVRTAAGPGAQSVRAAGPLAGLPRGSSQATLLLEKKP